MRPTGPWLLYWMLWDRWHRKGGPIICQISGLIAMSWSPLGCEGTFYFNQIAIWPVHPSPSRQTPVLWLKLKVNAEDSAALVAPVVRYCPLLLVTRNKPCGPRSCKYLNFILLFRHTFYTFTRFKYLFYTFTILQQIFAKVNNWLIRVLLVLIWRALKSFAKIKTLFSFSPVWIKYQESFND